MHSFLLLSFCLAASVSAKAIPRARALIRGPILVARQDQTWGPNMGSGINSGWMSVLPDDRNLAQLSIPGTHDTMTYTAGKDDFLGFVKCQNAELTTQLRAGIRYLDMRLHQSKDKFKIYHGMVDTRTTLDDVIATTTQFLDANPKEAIVMRMKHETAKEAPEDPSIPFDQAFDKYIAAIPKERLYVGTADKKIPNLGELRGRMIFLPENLPNQKVEWGLPYGEAGKFVIQDTFAISDIEVKWKAVIDSLNAAKNNPDGIIYMSHLSATADGSTPDLNDLRFTPYDCAMGYPGGLPGPAYTGINQRTFEELGKWSGKGRAGILIADFGGQGLIDSIIKLNQA